MTRTVWVVAEYDTERDREGPPLGVYHALATAVLWVKVARPRCARWAEAIPVADPPGILLTGTERRGLEHGFTIREYRVH